MKLTDYIAGAVVLTAGIFLLTSSELWLGGLLLSMIGIGQIIITYKK